MKTRITLCIGLLLTFNSYLLRGEDTPSKTQNTPLSGTINVFTTPDLSDLTKRWAGEFSSLNPKLNIKVTEAEDKNINELLRTGENLGFVSKDYSSGEKRETLWKIVVGRDVIVPVINSKNPFLAEIEQQGISQAAFSKLFENPANENWGTLLAGKQNAPVHIYLIDDVSIMTGVSKYLNTEAGKINGVKTLNDKELISAIQNDPFAIGFCKMVDITGTDNQKIVENIRLLPLDKNGNGKMDYMERIYDDMDAFSRGIWIGKYPKSLYSDIYLLSKAQPTNENEVAFLTWVLTDGQKFLNPNGYSDLVYNERQMQLDKLVPPVIYANTKNEALSLQTLLLIIFIGVIVLGFIVDLLVRYIRNKKAVTRVFPPVTPGYFDENSVVVPKGLFFDKTHTWAFMEKDGVVKIGIDDFLQHTTGPITRIEMKNPGEKIKKGEKVLSIIQKGKQLNIYAPISGTIIEHNNALVINSSIINSSPYADGWVYMIEPANWLREIQFLNMAEKYKNWLVQEFTRLKDFLALSLKMDTPEYSKVIFQDGGVLKDSILKDLGPEVWEDFQTKFIDTAR